MLTQRRLESPFRERIAATSTLVSITICSKLKVRGRYHADPFTYCNWIGSHHLYRSSPSVRLDRETTADTDRRVGSSSSGKIRAEASSEE